MRSRPQKSVNRLHFRLTDRASVYVVVVPLVQFLTMRRMHKVIVSSASVASSEPSRGPPSTPRPSSGERVVRGSIAHKLALALVFFYVGYAIVVYLSNITFAHEVGFSPLDFVLFDALFFILFTYLAWFGLAAFSWEIRLTDDGIWSTGRTPLPGRLATPRLLKWGEIQEAEFVNGTGTIYPHNVFKMLIVTKEQLRAILEDPRYPLRSEIGEDLAQSLGLKMPGRD